MPVHGLSGVGTSRATARLVGIGVVAAMVVGLTGWQLMPSDDGPPALPADAGAPAIDVTVDTESVGEGIVVGTRVSREGVAVGTVTAIERETGAQRIHLRLDEESVSGLTEGLSIIYAPANLFGITSIGLVGDDEGAPLRDGSTLDLTDGRVQDATTAQMLQSLGGLTREVLTPGLADLVARVARDSRGFTPILEAVIGVAETVAQTQRVPYSQVLQGFGETLQGVPSTLNGGLVLLDTVYREPYLRSAQNRERFDATVAVLGKALIPSVAGLLDSLQPDYEALAGMPVPLLRAITGAVGDPEAAEKNLAILLDRTDNSIVDSPAGPILRLALELNSAPAQGVEKRSGRAQRDNGGR